MVLRNVVIGLTLLAAQTAQARQMPEPPPSGIVVHLFGPGPVASNILPMAAPKPAAPGATPAYIEPSAGDILHQMFITGDPNEPASAKLPKGRPGEQN
jgi:hypothetical protein